MIIPGVNIFVPHLNYCYSSTVLFIFNTGLASFIFQNDHPWSQYICTSFKLLLMSLPLYSLSSTLVLPLLFFKMIIPGVTSFKLLLMSLPLYSLSSTLVLPLLFYHPWSQYICTSFKLLLMSLPLYIFNTGLGSSLESIYLYLI